MASIFSVQNLQTFLRRKNLPRPPGPPDPPGRPPPGRPPGPPGPPEGRSLGAAGALASGAFTVSSDMLFPLYSVGFLVLPEVRTRGRYEPCFRHRNAVSNRRGRAPYRERRRRNPKNDLKRWPVSSQELQQPGQQPPEHEPRGLRQELPR